MRVATTVIIGGMKDSSPMAILHNKKEKKERRKRECTRDITEGYCVLHYFFTPTGKRLSRE